MICNIIDFLNENTGAITVVLTFVLAVVNIYQGYNNKKQLKLLKNKDKPFISVGMAGIRTRMYLKLVNYGSEPAIDVRIKFSNQILLENILEEERDILKSYEKNGFVIEKGKPYYISLYQNYTTIDKKFKIYIYYKDSEGEKYSINTPFNIEQLQHMCRLDHFEQENCSRMKEIASSLKIIAENSSKKE